MSIANQSTSELLSEATRTPLIKIDAGASRVAPQLKEAWSHRELVYLLVLRDLKLRYRQTLLGVSWVILQPVLMTLVFTIFFGKLGRFESDGVPYSLFAFAGLLPWTFFANSVSAGSSSLLVNSSIITKVYFPRLLIPIAIVGVRLIDLLVATTVLVGLQLFYGVGIHGSIMMLPVFIGAAALLSAAIGSWLAVLNIRYRDVATLLPVLLQVWMFASPIIYSTNMIPPQWRTVYLLNPMVGIVEGFRACFFGFAINWKATSFAAGVILVLVVYVVHIFNRWQERLVDHL